MPKPRILANRTKELETFLKMAKGKHDCRIMLIEGVSGMGKTSLLSRFKQECPREIKYVPFDCKGVVNVAAFLSQVVMDLGHDRFPNFADKVKMFVQGGVDFSENDIAAEKMISIAINSSVDLTAQGYRLEQLQAAFFNDLEKLEHRTVITFDTYQSASDELREWIESKWLRTIDQRLKNVVTVIAGQSTPNHNSSVWGDECEHFLLTPIHEVEAWCEFCLHLSKDTFSPAALSKDAVKTATILGDGHPAFVHQYLLKVVTVWQ